MAKIIPESISSLETATAGEKRVFKILQNNLPEDYIVWYDIRVNERYPDFIVLGPDLGIVVLEVKDWSLNYIESGNSNTYTLSTLGTKANPLRQAREYILNIVNELKKDKALLQTGVYKNNLSFTFGYGVVFTKISRKSFLDSPFANTIDDKAVIYQDDLKELEENISGEKLIDILQNMIPAKFKFSRISEASMDRIRGNLFKEVKLSTDNDAIFKVMNLNQETYAKSLGYGHRVIRGVAGSGKTVILICRARYLADIHKDWHILVLCYNKTLASFLRNSIIENNIQNVEVSHFHGWINDVFKSLGLKSGIYKDKDINENIAKISQDMLGNIKKYDAIFIDEGQDLEKEWLEFIVKTLRNPEHSHLMLASDGAQNLYNRNYTLKSVGIKAAGRTTIMRENYRNTKEILDFAYTFLTDGMFQEKLDEEDNNFTIKPDTSLRRGDYPELISCNDFQDEANKIVEEIIGLKQSGVDYSEICVAYIHKSCKGTNYLEILESTFSSKNIPYFIMSKSGNTKSKFRMDMGKVNISTIHSVKGLDFKYVYICGINNRLLDSINESKKLLYVGMTRARDVLKVTYSENNVIIEDLLKAQINSNREYKNAYKVEDMVAAAKEEIAREEKNEGGFMDKVRKLFGM
ncbi:NERD domain-containing protein [Clostridium pasteurianum]|uniref:3'-5' exonuclease n=1 Tax=Clostridium pasteurianum TaxID=1501 RepID=UPI002260F7A4|nr:nuclease-related domain-containing DEAD/DEAH box helicase [Clostridium pasteurianum]UZW13466.1 NERD domain-containing protein [Clostridium pasteurianum]